MGVGGPPVRRTLRASIGAAMIDARMGRIIGEFAIDRSANGRGDEAAEAAAFL